MSKEDSNNSDFDYDNPNAVLARVDERTKRTNEILERVIEKRITPLENQVEKVDNRSRRNAILVSAITTALTIVGAWSLELIPI